MMNVHLISESSSSSSKPSLVCPWSPRWRYLLLPMDILLWVTLLPLFMVYLLAAAILSLLQAGCHRGREIESDDLRSAVPISLTTLVIFSDYVHAVFQTYPSIWYFSTIGTSCKMGLISSRILRVRSRFADGRDPATLSAYEKVRLMGGDSYAHLESLVGSLAQEERKTSIRFTSDDTITAARQERGRMEGKEGDRQTKAGRVAVLDAANRRRVGGSGMCPYGGSQEEDLIRSSNLYWLINPSSNPALRKQCMEAFGDTSHHIPYFGALYAPDVTFLLEDGGKTDDESYSERKAKDKEIRLDVIAAASVDFRQKSEEWRLMAWTKESMECIVYRKVEAILAAAAANQCTTVVLAATGCGVFARNPRILDVLGMRDGATEEREPPSIVMGRLVAQAFANTLKTQAFVDRFDRVVFAIAYNEPLLKAFQAAFEEHYYAAEKI